MWYDIKYKRNDKNFSFNGFPLEFDGPKIDYNKTSGRTAAEALEAFGHGYDTEGALISFHPVAIPLKHEWDTCDKQYWGDKWNNALVNMLAKTKRSFTTLWVTLPLGETPMPRFIEERAKGRMRMVGRSVEQQVSYISHKYEYGKIAALAIILGYITTDGKDTKRPRANCCALMHKINDSSRPRSPKVRRLLAELGTMDKDEIIKLLARKRKAMKRGRR
jgi:hypothetical protein